MSGLEDEVEGKAKEAEGTVTGDAEKNAEGAAQEQTSKVEQDAKKTAGDFEKNL